MRVQAAVALLCVGLSGVANAQTGGTSVAAPDCGVPPVAAPSARANIFTPQQEMWLGQVEADQLEGSVLPVRDASLNAHLQAIADRLLKALPPTGLTFRVTLVDSDEVNGFSLAGGHIYITRKLAAVARNDDQLAGVIGHEIGHIVSHQFAFQTTAEMKRLLNVTSVGDEADVRAKWGRMLDAEYRDKHPQLAENDADQAEADRIAVYLAAAAGYKPQEYAEFWNQAFFVGGKTGNRLTDLLGMTKPTEKRLRALRAMVAALPAGCGQGRHPDETLFVAWQQAVVANQSAAAAEDPALLREVVLTPPLQMALSQLRFSPDGKKLLAQNESSIYVLRPNPLTVEYRIDANGALPASFSPDSNSITFATPGLHVEQWSATEKKLLSAHELLPAEECYDPRLSPDGRTMVCATLLDAGIGLSMLDVVSSAEIWHDKNFLEYPSYSLVLSLVLTRQFGWTDPVIRAAWSPDGRFLVIGGASAKVALDMATRQQVKLSGDFLYNVTGSYAFLGPHEVAGANADSPKNSGLYSFPDGKRLQKLPIPLSDMSSVSNPGSKEYVLQDGLKDFAVGLADLAIGRFVAAQKTPAMDVYGNTLVTETLAGQVTTEDLSDARKPRAHVLLPVSPLGSLSAASISPDGRFLALSSHTRGGLWDLTTGKRLNLVYPFTDAHWVGGDRVYLEMLKHYDVPQQIVCVTLPAMTIQKITYKLNDEIKMSYGRLLNWKQDKKKTWTLSVLDPSSGAEQWNRQFPDRQFGYTASYGDRDLLFSFAMKTHTAKEAIAADPKLAAEMSEVKVRNAARLVLVINGESGKEDGRVIVEVPPAFAGTDGMNRAGDLLYVQGMDDRTAVYSISSGKKLREVVGVLRDVDAGSGRVITANRMGEGRVYDKDGREIAHYELHNPIRYAVFRDQGRTVLALTSDQKLRTLSVGPALASVEAAKVQASH